MKPLYKCEYCEFSGIEEKVLQHEETCNKNYNLKSCLTCKHAWTDGFSKMDCNKGKEIPSGKVFQHCTEHERGEIEIRGFMGALSNMFRPSSTQE